MMRRPSISALFFCFVTATASAQTPAPDQADGYFRQGNSLYKDQRWAEARTAFESAWRLKKAHDIAANLAYAEMKLGKWRDAAEHLAFAVKSWPPTGKADKRDYAIERLQLAKKEVGTLTIQIDVPRADVLVDGVLVGQAPLADEVFADPGSHTIEAKRAGYQDAKQTVLAEKGGAQTVTLVLLPVVLPPPAPPPPVTRTWRPGTALLVTGAALAVAGLTTGAGLTLAANGKRASADALRVKLGGGAPVCAGMPAPSVASDCAAFAGDAASRDALSRGAVAGFVLGGAFGLATAGLGAWAASSPNGERRTTGGVRVVPFAGADGGGLIAVGVW
jgi:hypothetical protein